MNKTMEMYSPSHKKRVMAEVVEGYAQNGKGGSPRLALKGLFEGKKTLPKKVDVKTFENYGFNAEQTIAAFHAEQVGEPLPESPLEDAPSDTPSPIEPTNANFSADNYLQGSNCNYCGSDNIRRIKGYKCMNCANEVNYHAEDSPSPSGPSEEPEPAEATGSEPSNEQFSAEYDEMFETIYTGDGNDEGWSECERTIEYGESIKVDAEGSVRICSDCYTYAPYAETDDEPYYCMDCDDRQKLPVEEMCPKCLTEGQFYCWECCSRNEGDAHFSAESESNSCDVCETNKLLFEMTDMAANEVLCQSCIQDGHDSHWTIKTHIPETFPVDSEAYKTPKTEVGYTVGNGAESFNADSLHRRFSHCADCGCDLDSKTHKMDTSASEGGAGGGHGALCDSCFVGGSKMRLDKTPLWKRAEEPIVEEPAWIPAGDGRALGQQNFGINMSPLHAESFNAENCVSCETPDWFWVGGLCSDSGELKCIACCYCDNCHNRYSQLESGEIEGAKTTFSPDQKFHDAESQHFEACGICDKEFNAETLNADGYCGSCCDSRLAEFDDDDYDCCRDDLECCGYHPCCDREPFDAESKGISKNAQIALGLTALGVGIAVWKSDSIMNIIDTIKKLGE